MRIWYKLVSVSLVLMALLAPSLSLALCAPHPTASNSMHCPPSCPMMAKLTQQHGNDFRANDSQSCCKINSSRPAPVTESFVVSPVLAVAPSMTVLEPVETDFHRVAAEMPDSSPPLESGAQALLCTFLI